MLKGPVGLDLSYEEFETIWSAEDLLLLKYLDSNLRLLGLLLKFVALVFFILILFLVIFSAGILLLGKQDVSEGASTQLVEDLVSLLYPLTFDNVSA